MAADLTPPRREPVHRLGDDEIKELIGKSVEAKAKAYAPYSKFHVGAALLTASGEIFTGK